jgi:hypothetical protein
LSRQQVPNNGYVIRVRNHSEKAGKKEKGDANRMALTWRSW